MKQPQTPLERAKEALARAVKINGWNYEDEEIDAANFDVYVFWLSNYSLIVHDKAGANALVDAVQALSKAGQPTHVGTLEVVVPPDPDPEQASIEFHDTDDEDEDFEVDDVRSLGLRAFRILKPLTKLPQLDELYVILECTTECGDEFLITPGQPNPAIRMFGAVIAKLKEMVVTSSKSWKFKVIQRFQKDEYSESDDDDTDKDDTEDQSDLTWLWDPPSAEDMDRMKQHTDSRVKAIKIQMRIDEMERSIHRGGNYIGARGREKHYDRLKKKKQRLEAKIKNLIGERLSQEDEYLVERCCVSRLAADPNWENAVEIIAKRRTPASDKWEPADSAEEAEDDGIIPCFYPGLNGDSDKESAKKGDGKTVADDEEIDAEIDGF